MENPFKYAIYAISTPHHTHPLGGDEMYHTIIFTSGESPEHLALVQP